MQVGNFGFGDSGISGGGTPIVGGGTLNYVSKFTPNGTTIANSLLYDNGTSVGLGTNTPDASALLDLSSTSQGFAAPRMTTLQRNAIVAPTIGLLIYNTSSSFFNYWDGSAWIQMDTSTGGDVSGSGTTNYAVKWTDGSNSVIGDGTWYFSGNDYLPVTTGSNIGDATHRIGTIFMASVFDYANDLNFYNGTSNTMILTTSGDLGINTSTIGAARLEIVGGAKQGAYIQSNGNIALNAVETSGYAVKGETSTGFGLFAKITNGSGTSGVAIRAHDQNGNTMFTVNGNGNVGIGTTTPTAKLDILQDTVGTGAKGLSVNFATIGETFYIDDNGYAKYYGGGFTIAGSNGILNLVSNGGVSPSISFKYNNGASDSGFLYGVGASMFFETPAFGLGTSYFNPQARLHIKGINSASANYALKVDNSTSSPLLYVRNDGNVYSHGVGGIVTNTAFGLNSLLSNITGSDNTVYGVNAMRSNTTGTNNTAIGNTALYNNNGSFNTATGYISLESNTGDRNTAFGYGSLSVNTTGIRNTAIGMFAGNVNAVGDNNVFIGYGANSLVNNLTNAIAIGYNAIVSASNSMVLGEGVNVGIGIPSPIARLHVSGSTSLGEQLLTLTTSSGLWDVLTVGQGTTVSRVNTFRMYGSGVAGTSANPTLILHDEVGGNPALYMYSNLYSSNTLAIDGLGIPRFTATYSGRMWFNSNVGVGLIATLDTRLYIQGSDTTLANYALKVDNLTSPLFYVRNDGLISINSNGGSEDTIGKTLNTTTNATVALETIAIPTDTVVMIESYITCRKTGGAGVGTIGDGNGYIRTVKAKNVGGVVTIGVVQSSFTSEDIAPLNATFAVSGTNIVLNVTGAANDNITWNSITKKYKVS